MSIEQEARKVADQINAQADRDFSHGVESAQGVDEESFVQGALWAASRPASPIANREGGRVVTPAELRAAAERLREGLFPEQGAWRTSDIETGAVALERLAAVIEHLEADLRVPRVIIDGMRPTPRVKTRDVLHIARGEEGE